MAISLSDHFTYKRLLKFAWPSILMMIFTSIYGVVDGFYISNYVGKDAFTAVNLVWPALMILGVLGFMMGSGGSALVGKTLGERNNQRANELFSLLVYFSIISGLIIGVISIIYLEDIVRFLGAKDELISYCLTYGRIYLFGMPLLILQYMFQSLCVTAEKPNIGLYATLASGLGNIFLDFLLVGVFKLQIVGAGVATLSSMVFGGLIPFIYFISPNSSLLRLGKCKFEIEPIIKACSNGASEFVSNVSQSVIAVLYNLQLMKYIGNDGVAAYGVLMYVCFIFLSTFVGFQVGTAPIVSYNYGAKNTDELKNILRKSYKILFFIGLMMLIAGELLSRPLSLFFVGYDSDLLELTVKAFRIYSFVFLFAFIPIYGSGFFTALNDGKTSAIISFIRTILFQIAAILIMPLIFGVNGIWYSIVVSEIAASILTIYFLFKYQKKYDY